ncbi:MAG: cation:proton antiporter [Candidatus Cloacimonetes bacterium]|nr:cation:proton antiporter [Candidatus Cloacimonadota bacterium]MCF7813345.1 cation:proton antiporter [Candidatus Cloacimonadota bacterium]MCF7867834.1 cation:proton antiporter [Candidatus Cloacimonadota bacterium]MCF7883280.1 cation:proton antiporter [Candidatus Cloacimonadota bacterium]
MHTPTIESGFVLPALLLIGMTIILGFYLGKNMKLLRLPSIIGFMIFGVILGPSLLNHLTTTMQQNLAFITDIALGFVALSIGMELKFTALKRLGSGIIFVILFESFAAFAVVFTGLYLLTGNLPLALLFAAIAPASAPAGTVAVIQEYKAKGSLTKALYAVVGFDDGLGIIIFGFSAAFAKDLILQDAGTVSSDFLTTMLIPLEEILFSFILGTAIGFIFSMLARKLRNTDDIPILVFGFVLTACGFSEILHTSIILTVMITGVFIINTQSNTLVSKIQNSMRSFMPLLFILFFTLAGANLHIKALPSLGIIGIIYVLARSFGLIFGSRLGATLGKVDKKIKNWIGLGILSQAGVAIGLALMVKSEFAGLGRVIEGTGENAVTTGDQIGSIILTTVTATCIFFEIIGPILTKTALTKAGEINTEKE